MSLYEGLSLLVSLVGTLFTIYLGLRQLRQAPAPASAPAPRAPGAPPVPRAAAPERPRTVVLASVFLYAAAALQVLLLIGGWTYQLLDKASVPLSERFGSDAAIDLLAFGAIGVMCGLVGLFVARGSRVAVWLTWLLGAIGVLFFLFLALSGLGFLLDPTLSFEPGELGPIVLASLYCSLLSIAFIVSASLLFGGSARAFRRRQLAV